MEENKRISKVDYYLNIAKEVAKRGTCLRRNYGSVIVKNDTIISTGYTGAPRGRKNCINIGKCVRMEMNIPSGERYELCRSVHSEANAIINASRNDMLGSILYLYGFETATGNSVEKAESCSMCKRCIINAGIVKVISRKSDGEIIVTNVEDWIKNDESLLLT